MKKWMCFIMNKKEKKEMKEVLNIILKGLKLGFSYLKKAINYICNIIEKYVPKEHVLLAFYIATTLSFFGETFVSSKISMIAWFITTAIIISMSSKKITLWVKEDELKEKEKRAKNVKTNIN